jgi:carbamoyl-phosphate synthase large subunit
MSSRGDINVLFTSAGRRVELLRAFREAYSLLGITGHVIALDADPLAPALQVADKPFIVPRLDSPDYIPALTQISRDENVTVIFPLIDPDIPLLARHRKTIEKTGACLAVGPDKSVEIVSDKWLTVEFFKSLNLNVPRAWLPQQLDGRGMAYPLFIKPRAGSASNNAFKVNNEKELLFFSEYISDPVIEEYLPGPEITNDVICDLDGKLLGVVSRRRIEVRCGEVSKGVTLRDERITAACAVIGEALPAIGPVTVQCMMKDGIPHFTEINARFGGGVPLGIAAGANSPAWVLARVAGIEPPLPPLGDYSLGLHVTRFDSAFFLSQDGRARLAGHRL